MKFLDYAKQYHNFDVFLVLVDDAGLTDEDIMAKFEVSKQRIYDARKRLEPVFKALEQVDGYKRDPRDPNIQSIVDAFSEAFGTTKSSKWDRFAAKRLHVKYQAPEVVKLINALANATGDKFAPSVNNVAQLEEKLPQVVKFLQTKSENVMIDL
jgi:predicted DNA-binding protein YlxM (UPF0122 family)